MLSEKYHWFLSALLICVTLLPACASEPNQDQIFLSPSDDGYWKVAYRLAQPTPALTLVRTPDDARHMRWRIASSGFEIGTSNDYDVISRTNGGEFSSVEILVPATYVPLPKDYAPFSLFSDGGLLIHSGRFQACPTGALQTIDDCHGPWLMTITAPPDARILLNGKMYDRSAQWSDSDDGTKVYVGTASLRSTSNFIGIVDPALPPVIAELLSALLPDLMEHFAQRLPQLQQRPMLFASYDPNYEKGHGRQGGTLPGQVFMHFYGPGWEAVTPDDNTPEEIAWFFAHEVGHLFQHDVVGALKSSWIHEGAAEAFAYFVLANSETVSVEYLAMRRQRAFDGCRDALSDGTLYNAAERDSFSDYYQCGLIMFLAIDAAIRVKSNDQQDLFDFWATLISDPRKNIAWDSREFLRQVENSADPFLAKQLLSLVFDKQDDPTAALDSL